MTHLCLTGAGPAAGGRSYLFYDKFTTADDAPITTPRTCEPGPGTLTFVQNDGTVAISGGKLVWTIQSTPAWTDLGCYSSTITRAAGRCLLGEATPATGTAYSLRINLGTAAVDTDVHAGFAFYPGMLLGMDGAVATDLFVYSGATTYQFCIVLRANGSLLLFKGGVYADWTLMFAYSTPNNATEYIKVINYSSGATMDNLRVPSQLWVPTPLVSDNFTREDSDTVGASGGGGGEESGGTGIASTELAGDWDISSNTLVTAGDVPAGTGFVATWAAGVASVLVQAKITLQANSVAGIVLSSDGTDWYRVAIDDANNVIRVHEYDGAGTYTQRASTAVTIAASTAYQLVAVRDGTTVAGYVTGTNRVAYTSASVNATATSHGLASSTAADAFDNLVIWSRTQTLPSF